MSLIEKYIEGNESKWIWFTLTLIGSLIPLILRFLVSLAFPIQSFDIKDLLFAALAINLSNFNLIGSRNFKTKTIIVIFSALLIIFISSTLGVFLCTEANTHQVSFLKLKTISIVFFLASVYMSFEANNYVFKTVHKS